MASRTYQNFDLLLEAADGGEFRARVTNSPTDESPTGKFSLPFDATQLENLLLKLDPGRSGTRRAGSDPQTQAAATRMMASVGWTITGCGRSSTRTSPGAVMTATRMIKRSP